MIKGISKNNEYKSSYNSNTKVKPIVINKNKTVYCKAFYDIVGAVINREIVYE